MDVSNQMLDAVANAKKQAKAAEKNFDGAADMVNIKSSSNIDLFGGRAVSQVADIASSVRKACDELYASYQSLVLMLDQQCRPLLSLNPSTRAVKEVMEMIKWLNSESEIGSNFSGSINGSASSDLVSVKYFPKMECQVIQKHWENVYASMPGTAEEDKAFRQRKAAAQKAERDAAREEQNMIREIRRQEQEQKRQEKEKEERQRLARNAANLDQTLAQREYLQPAQRMLCSTWNTIGFVRPDGKVDAFQNIMAPYGGTPGDVSRFSKIKTIVCTLDGYVGLRYDGSCICTNVNHHVDSHIWEANQWSNIIELAAGDHHVVGLRDDGTCVANSINWNIGYGYSGQSDVSSWRDITAVACGRSITVGIKKDGTVVATADVGIKRWENIALIAADRIVVGLTHDGKVKSTDPESTAGMERVENIVQLAVVDDTAYALAADGKVYGGRKLYKWDPDKNILVSSDAVAIAGGSGGLLVLKKNGNVERYGRGSSFLEIPSGYRLFDSYDGYWKEKKQKEDRRAAGVCQHCGGAFKKSLFSCKCTQCGMKKDY